MLAVAAAQPAPPATAPIRWVEASALAMPFPDASFDRVFCVEGTQFFPDRLAGFREIHRVLAPGGSLITSNWGPLSGNPGYHALSDALRSFVSDVAAILPPVGLSDPAEIAALAHEAGFTAIAVRADHLDLRLPSARDFVAWIAAGGPTIRHNMAQLSDDRRGDFLRFVEGRLARYAAPDGTLRLPSMRHILTAAR